MGKTAAVTLPNPVARRLALGLAMDFVLERSVVPHAGHRPAVDQRLGAVQALPVVDPGDQVLFDRVGLELIRRGKGEKMSAALR